MYVDMSRVPGFMPALPPPPRRGKGRKPMTIKSKPALKATAVSKLEPLDLPRCISRAPLPHKQHKQYNTLQAIQGRATHLL